MQMPTAKITPTPSLDVPIDLADHFMGCAKLGRYLTTFDDCRYLISDDFKANKKINPIVAASAAVFSKDPLVAQVALMPLARFGSSNFGKDQEALMMLFSIIEEQALTPDARECAEAITNSQFQATRIQSIEQSLNHRISPARMRYRQFLDVVRALSLLKISDRSFRDEFLSFTAGVAGKLDFGIYSFCIDRIMGQPKISETAKTLLIDEIITFPPLVRRELLSNALSAVATPFSVTSYIRRAINTTLSIESATEIFLLEGLKTKRILASELEVQMAGHSGR